MLFKFANVPSHFLKNLIKELIKMMWYLLYIKSISGCKMQDFLQVTSDKQSYNTYGFMFDDNNTKHWGASQITDVSWEKQ